MADWGLIKALKDRLAGEEGYYRYPRGTRTSFALVYPNTYYVGMSNLGLHIIYDLLNRREDTACERFFLPESKLVNRYENTRTPLMSLENQIPLADFDIIGFAVSFELDYFNILKIMSLGHVKLRTAERTARDPLVIAGGPCATFNPEPLAAIVDAFIIGEGEVIMPRFMEVYHEARISGLSRRALLIKLAAVPGVYIPSLYEPIYDEEGRIKEIATDKVAEAPAQVSRCWVDNLDDFPAHTVVVTDETEFNFYLIETARGCGRHCRFCMAGYCFRRPRNRSIALIEREVREAVKYRRKIGLMGAAISDYPEINELCKSILGEGLSMSVASFRADSVTAELVEALATSGLRTITLAPEAGSACMRAVINKGIEEEHLFSAVDLGIAADIKNFKLYIMIGLPFEEESDIEAIVDLTNRLKDYMESKGSSGRLTLSVNPFIPKPFTPFMWAKMADKKYLDRSLRIINNGLKARRNIIVNFESPKEAFIQGVLARGDRRLSEVLITAHEAGGRKAFLRALKEHDLEADFYLFRERGRREIFPWEIIDMGFSKEYLWREYLMAEKLLPTPSCFDGCKRCGVCS